MVIVNTILSVLWLIVKLMLALSIITIVHEFGHFLAAKALKIKVNEFSVGFGPKIFSFKRKETQYSFRAILLGGYNAIEGETGKSTSKRAFVNQSTWKKIIVLIMGSTFNLIFAALIFFVMALFLNFASTEVGDIYRSPLTNESIAENAGLQKGDVITAINDVKVREYSEISEIVLKDKTLKITFERNGEEYQTAVEEPVTKVNTIGIVLEEDLETNQNHIKYIYPGKQAMAAGLKSGDKIVKVNDVKVKTLNEAIKQIYMSTSGITDITVDRDGTERNIEVVGGVDKDYFDIGIKPGILKLNLVEKVQYAAKYVGTMYKEVFSMYGELFTGKSKINELSGIVGIGEVVSQTTDILDFINLIAVISLSVGIMNLLPIPPMDGGKLVIVIGEGILHKKLSEYAEAVISLIFFILLILLTLYVTWNDIIRIF